MNRNNALIYLGTALLAFGESFSRGNFPSYVQVLGGSLIDYGFVQSVRAFSNLTFLLPAAILADRLGHKRLLLAGTLVYTASYVIVAFAPSWEYLIVGILGIGLGNGAVAPSRVAILAHGTQNGGGKMINLFTRNETARWASLAGGFFISAFFFSLVNNEFTHLNLQFTMIVTLFYAILSLFPSIFLVNTEFWRTNQTHQIDNEEEKNSQSLREILLQSNQGRFIVGFLFINLIIGFGAGFLVPFTQPYFVTRFGLGPSEINIINGFAQILTTFFMTGIPLLTRRLADTKVIYLTEGLSIPLTLLLAFTHSLPIALIAFFFRMAFMNMSRPAQIAILQANIPDAYRATIQSLMQAGDRIGRGFSPAISAILITEANDFTLSFSITAGTYTTAVLTLFFITREFITKKQNKSINQIL